MKSKPPLSAYHLRKGEDEFDVIGRTRFIPAGAGIFIVWVAIVRGFRWLRRPTPLGRWTTWRADLWVVAKIVGFALFSAVVIKVFR